MDELPEEVWWYSEDRSNQRSVTMEPEGVPAFMMCLIPLSSLLCAVLAIPGSAVQLQRQCIQHLD